MKICIVGSGAIGGFLGVKLALSGHDMTFIDKGIRLVAIMEKGLKLIMQDGTEHHVKNAKASDNYAEIGPQDLVIIGLKSQHIQDVAENLPYLFGPETMVLTIQNGIPWWYFQKHGGEFDGHSLKSLDPNGKISAHIEADRIIGCVAYPASTVLEPGVIQHVEGDRFPIGELDGVESQRCQKLYQVLTDAGFRSRILDNIRSELWLKAWGTLSFNPISALTHATLKDICQFPETRKLAATMMEEAQDIANKLGIEFRHTIERRINGAESVGPHKTSMLQDIESGLDLEIEALVGSILEIGILTKTPAPTIHAVYACIKLLNQTFLTAGAKVDLIKVSSKI